MPKARKHHGRRLLAGSRRAVCQQQLAFLGANVIKVEPPGKGEGGRHIRATADMSPENMSSVFPCVNAGKRSMTLDLKHPRAPEVVRRLVSQADVVVQNFKVGVIDRLGFGYEAVRAINESIVYCSISGYGQKGPTRPRLFTTQRCKGPRG